MEEGVCYPLSPGVWAQESEATSGQRSMDPECLLCTRYLSLQ